jgi:hypothetical protein
MPRMHLQRYRCVGIMNGTLRFYSVEHICKMKLIHEKYPFTFAYSGSASLSCLVASRALSLPLRAPEMPISLPITAEKRLSKGHPEHFAQIGCGVRGAMRIP